MSADAVTGLHPDRALPADPDTRRVAREILEHTENLPVISMHGHVDVTTFTNNENFPDAAETFIRPDHYLTRMLGSQGVSREDLGIPKPGEEGGLKDPRRTWQLLCEHWHAFRGTPTRYWMEDALGTVFGIETTLSPETADETFDAITEQLAQEDFKPLALLDRLNIEVIATTDAADASMAEHDQAAEMLGERRVLPTLRPDAAFAVSSPDWPAHIESLGNAAGISINNVNDLLEALRIQRRNFIAAGARATDHGAYAPTFVPFEHKEAEAIFGDGMSSIARTDQERRFVSMMLMESARMSSEDGLTMQLHPGSLRNYSNQVKDEWGADVGYDIPLAVDYVRGLRPMLEEFGHHPNFTFVAFTLDEDTFTRELGPLAGVFPSMYLGAPWWFLDTPSGMRRYREAVTDSAGFYNTSGFVDDTRAFFSIPARHNLARRIDAGFLATLVAEHRLGKDEAIQTAIDLVTTLPRKVYPPLN